MFPLARVRKAGSEVILEEEEFGVGLSECGCPQEARLGLPHSQSPSPSRGKVSHPLPAEGKSAECRSCHFTSLAAFAPVSMAEHTYLGHHRGHFFFQLKNKNKNKSIHSHLSKRENSVAGGHSKTQRSQKEYVLPDPESVQNPRRAFSPYLTPTSLHTAVLFHGTLAFSTLPYTREKMVAPAPPHEHLRDG